MRTAISILVLLCLGAMAPPRPRMPSGPVESPKGKEQRLALRKLPAAPRAVILNYRMLVWKWQSDPGNPASNVVFVVHSSISLTTPAITWPAIAVCATNGMPFVLSASVPSMFYYVQASNTVSGLVSP